MSGDDYEPDYEPESVQVGKDIILEVLTVIRKLPRCFGCVLDFRRALY